MPLMAHPSIPNSLLLTQSGKLAGDPDCCCDDLNCCQIIKACANVIGSVANRTGILIVSGVANTGLDIPNVGICTRCTNANGSFMHSTGTYSEFSLPPIDTCGVFYNEGTPTNTFDFCRLSPQEQGAIGWWRFGFQCDQGPFLFGRRTAFRAELMRKGTFEPAAGSVWGAYRFVISENPDTTLISFCDGNPITLSKTFDVESGVCSLPSTVQMQLA